MAFDSGMLRCVCEELNGFFAGGKVEKVLQPEKDEVNLVIRSGGVSRRLLLSASGSNPRICVTDSVKENPPAAYMLCMLLRKHLLGAKVLEVSQVGFERVAKIEFDSGDELGFRRKRTIYLEIMGRNSTFVFCDEDQKILASTRIVDLSAECSRKLICGIPYELPQPQDKLDTLSFGREDFDRVFSGAGGDIPASGWIVSSFLGVSPLVARELVFSITGSSDSSVAECGADRLFEAVKKLSDIILQSRFSPCIISKNDSSPFEFSFIPIRQYALGAICVPVPTASEAIDGFYTQRDRAERRKQHFNDISTILKNASARISKKLALQTQELDDCDAADGIRLKADLIMQELYRIKKGDEVLFADDYLADPPQKVRIDLDPTLPPTVFAQKLYKEYAKKTSAKDIIKKQIENTLAEKNYIESVRESLDRASSEAEYSQIRQELSASGYGKRGAAMRAPDKRKKPRPDETVSPGGFRVLIGKNNTQNDLITFEIADKNDIWFHVKDYPGAHVLLISGGADVPDADREFAARLAAGSSGASGAQKVAVDTTLARYVKKPTGSKPGFVNYFRYTTVYVSPLSLSQALGERGAK
ncbi:MAG: NFACT family protein [Clostridia bacterium]|nr:NFACT family protein [Clostridia bacterium]